MFKNTKEEVQVNAQNETIIKSEEEIKIREERYSQFQKELDNIYKNEHNAIRSAINDIVGDSNNYGIYYEDLNTGDKVLYNENKPFIAASTIKIPVVMDAADMIASNILGENETITYTDRDYEDGTGILQDSNELNEPISINRLINIIIVNSDNIATNMLKRNCADLSAYIKDVTGISLGLEGNYITPKQEGIIIKKLYENKDSNKIYDDIINNMKNTIFHDRLDKYIPWELVAHKIGGYNEFLHDCGIIYTERPYSLSVYTESIGCEEIAKLSKNIYDIKINNDELINALKNNMI
jgi:beta-lactamase class A